MAELTAVKSSTISHVGYDKDSSTLTIRFTHGGTYEYPDVPESVHDALLASESLGKHFHAHIRTKFNARQVKEIVAS
jgi:hypothetical protein